MSKLLADHIKNHCPFCFITGTTSEPFDSLKHSATCPSFLFQAWPPCLCIWCRKGTTLHFVSFSVLVLGHYHRKPQPFLGPCKNILAYLPRLRFSSSFYFISFLLAPSFCLEILWSCLPSKQLIVPHSREYSYSDIHPACLVSLAVAFLILMIPTLYMLYSVTVVIIPTTYTWLLKRILVHLVEVCAGLFEETSTVHFRQACQYLKMCGTGRGHTLGNSLTSGPVAPFVLSPCSTQSLLSMTGEITCWMTPKVYTDHRVRTLLP